MSLTDLPTLNAALNTTSTLLLLAGYVCIRRQQRMAHRNCMLAACVTSLAFLTSYLIYHAQVGHTRFIEPAWFRPFYLGLLFTHLVGAIAIVPLVLLTLWRALRGRFEQHRRVARWTWPLWLYVSVTGVLIYWLLYHVFPQRA
jgi:uncharacterized membrane protein YozB (DUF420 family)